MAVLPGYVDSPPIVIHSLQTQKADTFTTGSTPVHFAAQKGDLRMIKKHVAQSKESVHLKDKNGWTPLHEAARAGHADVYVQILDSLMWIGWHCVCSLSYPILYVVLTLILLRSLYSVKYLVENGADKNELTGVGESALWWAKKELGNDNAVVELLEDMGALEMGPDL